MLVRPHNSGTNNNKNINTNVSSIKFKCQVTFNDVLSQSISIRNINLGSINHIHWCSDKKCKFEKGLLAADKFFSLVTKGTYGCTVPSGKLC